jgi:hypothetical protein
MQNLGVAMNRFTLTVALLLVLAGPAMAGGLGEAGELEHARANARAGGPVSERDAELLERYGCLSGTDNDFCRRLENNQVPRTHEKRVKKK